MENLKQRADFEQKSILHSARRKGFLDANAGSGVLTFLYKSECRRAGETAICLLRDSRHCELTVAINSGAMTEDCQLWIAARLAQVAGYYSTNIITRRQVAATRLTFSAAYDFVDWLLSVLSDPGVIVKGDMSSHKHSRIEFRVRGNGSLRVMQGAKRLKPLCEEAA